jgi:hypothetical protein
MPGQPITESDPPDAVAQPRVVRRRKGLGVVEARCGDVDLGWSLGVHIGERCSARGAERPGHRCGGVEFRRYAADEGEVAGWKGEPCHDRRPRRPTARFAVTDHRGRRCATDDIPDPTAQAPSSSARIVPSHGSTQSPPRFTHTELRSVTRTGSPASGHADSRYVVNATSGERARTTKSSMRDAHAFWPEMDARSSNPRNRRSRAGSGWPMVRWRRGQSASPPSCWPWPLPTRDRALGQS